MPHEPRTTQTRARRTRTRVDPRSRPKPRLQGLLVDSLLHCLDALCWSRSTTFGQVLSRRKRLASPRQVCGSEHNTGRMSCLYGRPMSARHICFKATYRCQVDQGRQRLHRVACRHRRVERSSLPDADTWPRTLPESSCPNIRHETSPQRAGR